MEERLRDIKRGEVVVVPGEHQLASGLEGLTVIRASLAPVPGGDAAFLGFGTRRLVRVGVERKEASNLESSWVSGELADQLRRMLENYDEVILLQEGVLEYDVETRKTGRGYSYDAIMNDLETWQSVGVRYQICALGDCGRRLWSLYHYYQKHEHRATQKGRVKHTSETPLLNVPGLGPKRTERLLRALLRRKGGIPVVKKVLGTGKTFKAFSEVWEELQ